MTYESWNEKTFVLVKYVRDKGECGQETERGKGDS
jgi:hypothetical protein